MAYRHGKHQGLAIDDAQPQDACILNVQWFVANKANVDLTS
jgi:hypothetical protein